jgi:hypothetical protein
MTFHIRRRSLRQSCRRDRRVIPGGQSEHDRVLRNQFFDLIEQPEINDLLTLLAQNRTD